MSRRRRAWVGLGIAVLLACGGVVALLTGGATRHRGGPPFPPGPPPTGVQFGVSVNRLFNDGVYGPDEIAVQLRALAATGAALARSDALWERSEPSPPSAGAHHYDWAFDDQIAGSLAAHGLAWLPILDYAAPWDQRDPGAIHSPPRAPADYAAFAAALAARYGPGGEFWRARPNLSPRPVELYEIWNEPDNSHFWAPAPDPGAYADLYLAARGAIKAADPGARVIVGGLTRAPAFLPAMLEARPDLLGQLDGVGIHPYGPDAAVVLARVRRARRALDSLGLPKVPLYVTEFGWTVHPAGALDFAPASRRPHDIATTLDALGHSDCGVAAAVLYTWVTPERDPLNKEDWFGIHPPSGGTSRDTQAFTAGLANARRPGPALASCS